MPRCFFQGCPLPSKVCKVFEEETLGLDFPCSWGANWARCKADFAIPPFSEGGFVKCAL
jgi:hypothetical protein